MMQYIKNNHLEATFPNIEIALRIFECISVCNVSFERSFNALKRVTNFQRSKLGQDNLNDLEISYIESDMLEKIDFENVIDKEKRKSFNAHSCFHSLLRLNFQRT